MYNPPLVTTYLWEQMNNMHSLAVHMKTFLTCYVLFLGQQLLCEYDGSDRIYIFLHERVALDWLYSVE